MQTANIGAYMIGSGRIGRRVTFPRFLLLARTRGWGRDGGGGVIASDRRISPRVRICETGWRSPGLH